MADIKFPCPHCGQHLVVDETALGQTVPCPACSRRIVLADECQQSPAVPADVKPNVAGRDGTSAADRRVSRLSVASLVTGILSFIVCGLPLVSVPAIVLAHISRAKNRQSTGQRKGAGIALAGLILGYASLALFALLLTLSIAGVLHGEKKEVSSITWRQFREVYGPGSNSTELQRKDLWKDFGGKRVKWTGAVIEVNKTLGTVSLQLMMPGGFLELNTVTVMLRRSERLKALALHKGDTVTFTADIFDQNPVLFIFLEVTLFDGEIVDVESASARQSKQTLKLIP